MKRLLLCCAMTLIAASASASIEDAIEATCRVRRGTSTGTGAAFHRDERSLFVLTNYHVAGATGGAVSCEFWRRGYGSRSIPGQVVWHSYAGGPPRDIAVVAIPLTALGRHIPRPVPLAATSLRTGETIVSVGCARGAWPSAWQGHVTGRTHGRSLLRFLPAPENGRSGSAIFNAAGTRIVGLIAWSDGQQGLAMSLEELLAAFQGEPATRATTPGFYETETDSEEAQRRLDGLVEDVRRLRAKILGLGGGCDGLFGCRPGGGGSGGSNPWPNLPEDDDSPEVDDGRLERIERRLAELEAKARTIEDAIASGDSELSKKLAEQIERTQSDLKEDIREAESAAAESEHKLLSALDRALTRISGLESGEANLLARVEGAVERVRGVRESLADLRAAHPEAGTKEVLLELVKGRAVERLGQDEALENLLVRFGIPSGAAVAIAFLLRRRLEARNPKSETNPNSQ